MRICIYEDGRTTDLAPLTLTRPASDLLCGLDSLGDKQARHFAAEEVGYLCRPILADLLRDREPRSPVNDPAWLRSAPTVMVNARWLPLAPARRWPAERRLFASGPVVGLCGGDIAYAVLEPRWLQTLSPTTVDDCLDDLSQALSTCDAGGQIVARPWDLIDRNAAWIAHDFETLCRPNAAAPEPSRVALVGPAERLFVHPTARIDPMVVADTTSGPVWIGPDVAIDAFTRLEGPCAIGAGTRLLGAKVRAGTTLGPQCRIGGEVECSIVQGYANKYHEGFLGHSHVGEWVNLAAGTITGDLRFDYRAVTVRMGERVVPTGRVKLGSVIGDHARTGLGVLLDCGSVIGAFATIQPTGQFAPRNVPSFVRHGPDGLTEATEIDRVMKSADVAMRRRGKELTPALEAVYRAATASEATAAPRLSVLPTAELRKSA